MTKIIDSKIPEGPIAEKWTNYKAHQKLVNPANKRRLDIMNKTKQYMKLWRIMIYFTSRLRTKQQKLL